VLKWSRLGKNNGSSQIVVDPFLLFLFSPALQVPTWPETMGPPRFFFPGASFRGYVDPLAVPHSRRLLAFLQWTGAGRGAAQQWNGRGGGRSPTWAMDSRGKEQACVPDLPYTRQAKGATRRVAIECGVF